MKIKVGSLDELTRNETIIFNELETRNKARVSFVATACKINVDQTEDFQTLRQIQENVTNGSHVQTHYLNPKRKEIKVRDLKKTQLLDLFEINQVLIKIELLNFSLVVSYRVICNERKSNDFDQFKVQNFDLPPSQG